MKPDQPFVLRQGEELTTWPWIKMRIARAQVDELSAHIDIWNLEHPFIATPKLSPDRQVVEFRVTECSAPPLTFWSALVGNSIASLRSAADSFAWQIAHLGGNAPPNPKSVYFPMTKDLGAWQRRLDALGDLHPELLRRFGKLRESHEGQWMTAVSAIATFNNIDKHRAALRVVPHFERAALVSSIELPRDHGGMTLTPEPIRDLQTIDIGDVVARMRFSGPIGSVAGTVLGTTLPILSDDESTAEDAVTLTAGMHNALQYGLQYLCRGEEVSG